MKNQDQPKPIPDVLDSLPEPICEADTKGNVTYANKAALKAFGYTKKDLKEGISIFQVVVPEEVDAVKADLANVLKGQDPGWVERTALRKNGSTFNVVAHSSPVTEKNKAVGVRVIAIDITKHIEGETKFKHLYEFAPTPYHTLTPEGVITDVNESWVQILGFSKEEVIGKSIFDFVREEERSEAETHFKSKKESQEPYVKGSERHFVAKDGTLRTFRINDFISFDDTGKLLAVHTTMEDITEREKTEQELRDANVLLSKALTELRRTQKQVVEQERLSALGQMASGMAHDFNNALMPIVGFSEYLLSNPDALDDREEVLSMLTDIRTAAEDARQAVQRLRSFYRPVDEGKLTPLNLNDLVTTAINLTQPRWKEEMAAAGRAVEIKTDLGRLPAIRGNEAHLREAVTNVLLNALDAMPEGGTVTVRTRTAYEKVILELSDTGVGMSEDVRQKCFEPFFTTKGRHGTGMGLAVVFGTVRQHNGTINVDSDPEKGTTFTFSFPRHQPTALEMVEKAKPAPALRKLNILVVDDEARARDSVALFLRKDQHDVTVATSGKDGLKKYQEGEFDLVVTDRAMPDMSGDLVAEKIMTVGRGTPVIMLTGFGEMMKDTDAHPLGVNIIVSKPITPTELKQAIADILGQLPDNG